MLRTTVILAHPSLEKSTANRHIIKELTKANPQITIHDIAVTYPDYNINIEAEQKTLLEADVIIFQFPFFWYSMPAILKKWFDDVFAFNFAFGPKGEKLKGKYFLPSLTIGGPAEAYHPEGYNKYRIEELLKPLEQTASLTKMNYLPPIYEHRMIYSPNGSNTKEEVMMRASRQAQRILNQLDSLEKETV